MSKLNKRVVYTKEVLDAAVSSSTSYAGVARYLGRPQSGGLHYYLKKQLQRFGLDTSHFTGSAHARGKSSPRKRTQSKCW